MLTEQTQKKGALYVSCHDPADNLMYNAAVTLGG